jgi:hypothetical protein
MSKKKYLHQAVAAALFAASGVCNVAFAVDEVEPNDSIGTAQPLVIGSGPTDRGRVELTGVLGSRLRSEPLVADVDFYSFEAKAGDLLTVDIDNGVKDPVAFPSLRSVDTIIAVFGPQPSGELKRQMTDGIPIDFFGSVSSQDARIENWFVPSDGTYVIGVSSHPRFFINDGKLTRTDLPERGNGAYTMIISGVTPAAPQVQHMNIEIKPGSGEFAPINPKAQGSIPVALLSSDKFDALKVDRTSLTFGRTGDENSMRRCSKEGSYVNADNLLDLVCHFDYPSAKFDADSLEGIVKGKTEDGRLFEGRATLKVVPAKD